jgi:hypothetical protein
MILSMVTLPTTQQILHRFFDRLIGRAARDHSEATNALRFWSDQDSHDVDRILRERRLNGS